jgi:hypothetical protein
MTPGDVGTPMSVSVSPTRRLRRWWNYYRRYTKRRTGIHAAATAALTGFGLLAYFERWFVAVAIVSYLLPPIYLYLTGDDLDDGDERAATRADRDARRSAAGDADGIDADSDGRDRDTDTDGIDADADADGIDADADADG